MEKFDLKNLNGYYNVNSNIRFSIKDGILNLYYKTKNNEFIIPTTTINEKSFKLVEVKYED